MVLSNQTVGYVSDVLPEMVLLTTDLQSVVGTEKN